MIKFSMKKKAPIPFQIEDENGVAELCFTKYTIGDALRINRIQQKYIGDDCKLTEEEVSECLSLARIVTCVKKPDGDYYFDEDVEPLRGVFGGETYYHMLGLCSDMNPTPIEGESLDDKKK